MPRRYLRTTQFPAHYLTYCQIIGSDHNKQVTLTLDNARRARGMRSTFYTWAALLRKSDPEQAAAINLDSIMVQVRESPDGKGLITFLNRNASTEGLLLHEGLTQLGVPEQEVG